MDVASVGRFSNNFCRDFVFLQRRTFHITRFFVFFFFFFFFFYETRVIYDFIARDEKAGVAFNLIFIDFPPTRISRNLSICYFSWKFVDRPRMEVEIVRLALGGFIYR